MNPDGPYLSVAALCDAVLDEKNQRISCIRFADTVNAVLKQQGEGPALEKPPAIPININGLVSFKSGKFKGTKTLKINLVKPSGEIVPTPQNTFPAVFTGQEEAGINLIINFMLVTDEGGLYWFDIYLDEEIVTRIPLKVNVQIEVPQSDSATVTQSSSN